MKPVSLQRSKVALSLIFALCGFAIGSYASRIPTIKTQFGLAEDTLGLILLCATVGSMLGFAVATVLVRRIGSQRANLVYGVSLAASVLGFGLAPQVGWLALVAVWFGFSFGGLDIAMNTQAIELEFQMDRHIMNGLHAMFSVGSLVGAGVGVLFAKLTPSLLAHVGVVAALGLVLVLSQWSSLLSHTRPPKDTKLVAPKGAVLWLGLIVMCAGMSEGAVGDWSGVHIKQTFAQTDDIAGLGFFGFSLVMTVMRFVGDALTKQYGWRQLVPVGGIVAACCVALGAFAPVLAVSVLGFALVGLGLSVLIPVCYSLAGKINNVDPNTALAAITSLGYGGYMLGPSLIGFVSKHWGTSAGFAVVLLLCLAIPVMLKKLVSDNAIAE